MGELPGGRYCYECEVPSGPEETDYESGPAAENVDFPPPVQAMESHLNRNRS